MCVRERESPPPSIRPRRPKAAADVRWGFRHTEARDTLHPEPCTLRPASYTLHPTPYTLHPAPCTLHATPHTLYPAPYTPTPYTLLVCGLISLRGTPCHVRSVSWRNCETSLRCSIRNVYGMKCMNVYERMTCTERAVSTQQALVASEMVQSRFSPGDRRRVGRWEGPTWREDALIWDRPRVVYHRVYLSIRRCTRQKTFVSLNSRLESNKEEEENLGNRFKVGSRPVNTPSLEPPPPENSGVNGTCGYWV